MRCMSYCRVAGRLGIVLLVLCIQQGSLPVVQAQTAEGYALVDAVNTYRASLGLPRLTTSDALMIAAQRHVEWMAANYTYSHTGEGGSRPEDRAAAAGFGGSVRENVGGSTWATPGEMIFFWDESYIHQVAMRAASATHIGAGFAANDDQRLYVLLIGTAPGQVPQSASEPVAGGTPAIAYTPPPGLVWTTDGETHQGSDYVPAAPVPGETASNAPEAQAAATQAAYVMPFNLIRRAEPGADGSIVHIVEAGQTAWAIAARYGVDVQEIMRINHLDHSPVLHQGDNLIIKLGEGQAPLPEPTLPSNYTVQAGDSLWTIAARYGRSVADLRTWNNLTAGAIIQPGDVLLVVPPEPTETVSTTPSFTPVALPSSTSPSMSAALPSPMATATSSLTPVPTARTAINPSPKIPTRAPLLAEVAHLPTAPPGDTKESTAPAQRSTEFVLLLLLLGVAAALLTVFGSIVTWLAHRGRRKPIHPQL